MSNLVIVAIPDQNDRVWKVSSEKIPHLTLLFLGDVDAVKNVDKIEEFVEHAANTTLNRFYLPVDRRGELGDDKADVLFFRKTRYDYKAVRDFRATLLKDNSIRTAFESAEQYEGWTPHLTLGYPATPAKSDKDEYPFYDVCFDRVAVWYGDYEGPEFVLKDYWEEFSEYEMMDPSPELVAHGAEFIEHFGVKGMKWGVRKADISEAAKTAAVVAVKGTRATVLGVKKHAPNAYFNSAFIKREARQKVVNEARKNWAEKDVGRINNQAKYKDSGTNKLSTRLKKPNNPLTREYRSEMRTAYRDRINEEVAKLPTNLAGDRRYEINDGGRTNANYFWNLKVVDVKHAVTEEEDDFLGEINVRPVFDDDGLIVDVELMAESIAQTAELGEEFLAHYGIKGMRWGVHNADRPAPVAKPSSARSVVPHGAKKKTKVEVDGGENHPASEDAIKVAQARVKLKKSGAAALSNKELQEVANRIELEARVSRATQSGTQKFISNLLKQQGQQTTQQFVQKKVKEKTNK